MAVLETAVLSHLTTENQNTIGLLRTVLGFKAGVEPYPAKNGCFKLYGLLYLSLLALK